MYLYMYVYVLVRRVAGQPRHLRHVRPHAPLIMRCFPSPFFPFFYQAPVTFRFTSKFFIHGVILLRIPAGRFVRQDNGGDW